MSGSSLDAVLERAVEAGAVPGLVVAVTDREGTRYQAAAGAARSSDGAPMQVDSVFRIASMTKLVTSLAVMMLHDEGRIDLDRPFADYVPAYRQPEVLETFDATTGRYRTRPAREAVTVRHLLTHTSGYGYWFLDDPLMRLTGAAPDLLHPPFLMHEPGSRFAYGTSTDVLGQIVEPVAGVALETFFAERIFAPLGMADTGFALPADRGRLVGLHFRASAGFGMEPIEATGHPVRGGGGLYSSAHDFACLLRLLLNQGRHAGTALLSPGAVAAMTANQIGDLAAARQTTAYPERSNDFLFMDGTQKFGFGVLIETRDRPHGLAAGSYGWAGLLNTYFWVDPKNGIAGVLMAQLKPFCDPACIELYAAVERAVYAEIVAEDANAPARPPA